MSSGCVGDDRWNCVESESGGQDKLDALDQLYLVCDASLNTTQVDEEQAYPHRNRDDIDVKAACWEECNRHFDELYSADTVNVTHSGGGDWSRPNKNSFVTQISFGDRVVSSLEAPYDPLAITLWEPHLDLSIPAELTLNEFVGSYSIQSEIRLYPPVTVKRNLYVAAWLRIWVRPKITAAGYTALAAAGFETLDMADPFEIRFVHPSNSEQEHPVLSFIARGPEGGIIPGIMEWRGIKGDNAFQERDCEPDDNGSCCEMLRDIHRVVVDGQYNNLETGEEADQLYQGGIGFRVRPIRFGTLCECV
jgi:hypothetical protein